MLNRFHPVYTSYTYLAGSRVDIERVLEANLELDDPEDVIDQFSEPPQFFERLSPVTTIIGDTTVKGRNWTDMMIKSYRLFGKIFMRATAFLRQSLENEHNEKTMVPFMSMAVDPDALTRLIEYDYEAGETSYNKLIELFETGAVAPTITTPFHSILPLLPTAFDRRLTIRLGFLFYAPILHAYERYLKSINENQMAIAFWAPEAAMDSETFQIIHEEFLAFCQKEKFKKPHLILLLDADQASEGSLDRLMKLWRRPTIGGKTPKDVTVLFRDPTFSNWMMQSHPSIKKIIDRTIAKVDANLSARDIDYTWAHFESLETLTWSPRDAVNYEQRLLKLCELGYLSVSPDTYVRRKLNGHFGVGKDEPVQATLIDHRPHNDPVGAESYYGRWRGWGFDEEATPRVMPNKTYVRQTPGKSEKRQGSPCWKIAWNRTQEDCFRILGGDPETMTGGVLELLANFTGAKTATTAGAKVEAFLSEYSLIYWREHFIQHNLSEADVRLDEIAQRTLRKGSRAKMKLPEIVAAGCAAQAYYFLLDSCNSYALEAENLDQRAIFQNVVMLSLAFSTGVAAFQYLGDTKSADKLVDALDLYLLQFSTAYERYNLVDYGVSKQAWNKAMDPEVNDSKANVVERAARRVAARHLEEFGYEDQVNPEDVEISTNVGHHWSAEVNTPNYEWANPHFCGVREA